MNDIIEINDTVSLEKLYASNVSNLHRKKFAQFFTPVKIANFLCAYILDSKREIKYILEPAFGLGIFSRVLRNTFGYNYDIKAFEIDDSIINFAKEEIDNYNINLSVSDYLNTWDLKPDCIICNPPYLKFHDYDNISSIKLINDKLNSKLNGYTNLYALFILKSLSELPFMGRAAYIVPSEFFNSDYGVSIKKRFLESKMLKYVINFHFEENIFEDALTTATLLLFENNCSNDNISFFNINSVKELEKIENIIKNNLDTSSIINAYTYPLKSLDPTVKWRNYYQKNVVYKSNKLVNFRNFCVAKRGIATGANDYFSFNNSKIKEFGIKEENLLPCICKSTDVNNLFFSKIDLDDLKNKDKKVFLVDLRISQDLYVKKYIQIGEDLKINEKFLTKCRNPWYSLENKKPADIWAGVFNREGIKFIYNDSKALNLTTFHGIYIVPMYKEYKEFIFAYLLTDLSKEIFHLNKREYGNGLNKFEPNDINNSNVFNFSLLNKTQKEELKIIIDELKVNQNDKNNTTLNISRLDEYFRGLL